MEKPPRLSNADSQPGSELDGIITFDEECDDPAAPGIIYMLTSPTGKSYIGQTTRSFDIRMNEHRKHAENGTGHCYALYNAIRLYGWDSFEKRILVECPAWTLNTYETEFIKTCGTLSPGGYNLDTGGGVNRKLSDETRARMSYAAKFVRNNSVYSKEDTSAHRRSEEAKLLPKRLQRLNNDRWHGYRIKDHPSCPSKQFADPKVDDFENLQRALQFLARLDAGEVIVVPKGPRGLPIGLYKTEKGYKVYYTPKGRKSIQKYFENQSIPIEDRYFEALFVLTWAQLEEEFPLGFDFDEYIWNLYCSEPDLVPDETGDCVIYHDLDDPD